MADSAGGHRADSCPKYFFHKHRAVHKMPVFTVRTDRVGRCIDDVDLLRTLALVDRHRPAAQRLVCGAIIAGHPQLPLASTTFPVFGSLVAVIPGCQWTGNKTNEAKTTAPMIFMKSVPPRFNGQCSHVAANTAKWGARIGYNKTATQQTFSNHPCR